MLSFLPPCQSFAPNHCCVVTPERLGLCGACWLDSKATFEIDPIGPAAPLPRRFDRTRIMESGNRSMSVYLNTTHDRGMFDLQFY